MLPEQPGSLKDFALAIVSAESLVGKLGALPRGGARPADDDPATDAVPWLPGRPPELVMVSASEARTPPLEGMADPDQRARILHAFANHELQAVELFAWALLAHAQAPAEYRQGLAGILGDEQRHLAAYCRRLDELGTPFGTWPVSGFFWGKLAHMATPRRFLCAMCLTFEQANLDHSLDYAEAARRHGDEATARLLEDVHGDERRHVAFGLRWLERFLRPGETLSEAYETEALWPLRAERARGRRFHARARRDAGMDEDLLAFFEAGGRGTDRAP